MQTEQAKGRSWNGYVCPGCRNVFRVAADFTGDEVSCPSCLETLRLPRNSSEAPPIPASLEATASPPAPQPVQEPTRIPEPEPTTRRKPLLTSSAGRRKLAFLLGIPLLLVAITLMLMPPDPSAETPTATPASAPIESIKTPAKTSQPPPPPVASPPSLSAITPEVPQNDSAPPPPPPPATVAGLTAQQNLPETPPATASRENPSPTQPPATPSRENPAPTQPAATPTPEIDPDEGLVQALPADVPAKPVATSSEGSPAAAATEARTHTVVRGDNLTRIARKYSTTPRAIMRANGLKNDVIRLGSKLIIPPPEP